MQEENLNVQIKKQIEFYFNDSNYLNDRFLREEIAKSSDGYLPFTILLKFKKLAALTTDVTLIVDSLKDSALIEINESQTGVKRSTPLPTEQEILSKRLLLIGFLKETFNTVTVESINEYFNKNFSIEPAFSKLLRQKAQCWVDFGSIDEMTKIANQIPSISFDGSYLNCMPYLSYQALSFEEKKEFEKNIQAMLHVPGISFPGEAPDMTELYEIIGAQLWKENPRLQGRIKLFTEEPAELYIYYQHSSYADEALKICDGKLTLFETEYPVSKIEDTEKIKNRRHLPSNGKRKERSRDSKPKEPREYLVLMNLPSECNAFSEIKSYLSKFFANEKEIPFIEYHGGDQYGIIRCEGKVKGSELYEKLKNVPLSIENQKVEYFLTSDREEDILALLSNHLTYPKNLIVKLEEMKDTENVTREFIKTTLNDIILEQGEIAFIKYQQGEKNALLRMNSKEASKKVLALINSNEENMPLDNSDWLKLKQHLTKARMVENEEEKDFYIEMIKAKRMAKNRARKIKRQRN